MQEATSEAHVSVQHRRSTVSEAAVRLHRSSSGEGALCVGTETIAHLSRHPHLHHTTSANASGNVVLMRSEAELVLDRVALEEGADPECIHAHEIWCRDGSRLARAVWFKASVADRIAGLQCGTFHELSEKLRRWGGQQHSDREVAGIQPASGVYITVGNGILPGRSREGISVGGEGTNIPFTRAPMQRTSEIEEDLGALNSAATECLLAAYPDMEEWCVSTTATYADCSERDEWLQVCQFPAAPPGVARTFPSHQVVLRGHLAHMNACASGADLHIDKMDGGNEFGGCCMFIGDDEAQVDQWRDFAIFEGATGGRGAAVNVLSDDWVCLLCCQYRSHLHGTVFQHASAADDVDRASLRSQTPKPDRMEGMHVVSYNLKRIETFVNRIGGSTAVQQQKVVTKLDSRLRRIARNKVWIASRVDG